MKSEREAILERTRNALAGIEKRALLPDWDRDMLALQGEAKNQNLVEVFMSSLNSVHGVPVTSAQVLSDYLVANHYLCGYCEASLWANLKNSFSGTIQVDTVYDETKVDVYSFCITAAIGAIAETGTLMLSGNQDARRLASLAPWVHVAVLKKETIHPDISTAVLNLGKDAYVVWVTGPSKTADVEGILIEGVHGPGVQIALVL